MKPPSRAELLREVSVLRAQAVALKREIKVLGHQLATMRDERDEQYRRAVRLQRVRLLHPDDWTIDDLAGKNPDR